MFDKCATFAQGIGLQIDKVGQPTKCPNHFPVHQCISWDILSLGRKWDILSPEKCQTMVFLWICRKYGQKLIDMPEIRASFAQGMGIQIEKVVQYVACFVPFLANLAPFYPCS